MRSQLYDEKSARSHIKKVVEILTKPQVLSMQQPGSPEEDQLNELAAKNLPEEEMAKAQEEIFKSLQQKHTDKQKQQQESFMKIIERESKKDLVVPSF